MSTARRISAMPRVMRVWRSRAWTAPCSDTNTAKRYRRWSWCCALDDYRVRRLPRRYLGIDRGHQLIARVRLREQPHNRHFETSRIVRRNTADDNRGDGAEMPVATLALHEFPAVHDRHHQVEQDQVGTRATGELCQRVAPVGRLDDVVARR